MTAPVGFTTRPRLQGTLGMVASTHWLASAAGMAALEGGGTAVDAAVTAGFVLQVVEPHLNGPAGEVPVLLAGPRQPPLVVCGQGPAPAGATPEAFAGLDHVPGTGLLAACVPGAFDAWLLLLRDHGTIGLREALEPAVGYAEQGYPVVGRIAATVATVERLFREAWPTSAGYWLPPGGGPVPGGRWRNPQLAATYRRLVAEGEAAGGSRERQVDAARRAWREGFVAEALADWCRRPVLDDTGAAHAGLLSGDDLAAWSATTESPVTADVGEWTVCKTGPWGQGPVFLQQLRLLEALGGLEVDPHSVQFVHLATEVAKLAFADRDAWYGDPDHVDVPLEDLLSHEYARERAGLVGATASLELRPGSPGGRTPWSPPVLLAGHGPAWLDPTAGATAEPTVARSGSVRGDTCHVDVVDRWGTLVSATPSGGWLQSSPHIPALGFPLGTRLQMTWLDPAAPAAVRPRARPRTTLTPSLALRDGEPVLAFGTPGGDQQDQWSLVYFVRLVTGGLERLQAEIDAPAFHTNGFPSSFHPRTTVPGELVVEERFGERAVTELRRRGHRVTVSGPWSLGRLCAVARDPATGLLSAAANPRGMQGYAVGR